jgi:hypothetical protein
MVGHVSEDDLSRERTGGRTGRPWGVKVSWILAFLSLLSLAIFAALWGWIAYGVWNFKPSPGHETYEIGDDLVAFASLFGTTVAVGTAAVLGIEIQKLKREGRLTTLSAAEATLSPLIALGVFTYAAVGATVLAAWLTNQSVSPDVVKAFAMTFAGWILGGFAAVFRAATA